MAGAYENREGEGCPVVGSSRTREGVRVGSGFQSAHGTSVAIDGWLDFVKCWISIDHSFLHVPEGSAILYNHLCSYVCL